MHDHKRTIIIPVMRKAHTGNLKSKRYGSFLNQKDLLTGTKQRNIIRTSGRFNKRLKKRREHKHEIQNEQFRKYKHSLHYELRT